MSLVDSEASWAKNSFRSFDRACGILQNPIRQDRIFPHWLDSDSFQRLEELHKALRTIYILYIHIIGHSPVKDRHGDGIGMVVDPRRVLQDSAAGAVLGKIFIRNLSSKDGLSIVFELFQRGHRADTRKRAEGSLAACQVTSGGREHGRRWSSLMEWDLGSEYANGEGFNKIFKISAYPPPVSRAYVPKKKTNFSKNRGGLTLMMTSFQSNVVLT
jgi:hypothetical protein